MVPIHSGAFCHNPFSIVRTVPSIFTSSGIISGASILNTGDHNTSGAAYVVGIITHEADTPPAASGFPQGTIYLQYTA